eukprot:g9274.t1
MQDIASSLHPIDYLDAVGENICDVSGTCADLFESMVLILSLSLIIGARGSAVPYFFTSLPVWIVAAGNLACACVAHRSHVRNHFTSRQVRWYMRLNLLFTLRAAATASVLAAWPLRWRRGAERGGAELRDALERRGYVEVELSMEEVKLLEEALSVFAERKSFRYPPVPGGVMWEGQP